MDITDFQNTKKYHSIIPFMYILSWVTMITGPLCYPVWYMNFYMILLIYIFHKVSWFTITMVIIFIQSWRHMNRLKNAEQGKSYQSLVVRVGQEVNYAFIIPNYKQQIQVIQQTLDLLASHKRAKAIYLVFLAMEAHQEGSDIKAKTLLKKYEGQFRVMDFSHHKIRQYQQKGKASNVSWCAQNLQPIFQKNYINPDSVMLTIIDVDSWVPDLYMDVVDQLINKQYDQRHLKIFQPIQIFTRNHLDVPVVTRVYDIIHSSVHMMNLYSPRNVTFSLSNYTMSYNLVKRVGFWDTVPEAIGEDFHMVFKAHFKTNFQITPTPIYIPFNQLNISTGNGYWADCKARFWQTQRHAKGIADMAYCLKRWLKHPCNFKAFTLFWFVFEAFCLGSLVPWISFATFLQQHLLGLTQLQYIYQTVFIKYFVALFTLLGCTSYILFQMIKRRANKIIYKRENQSLWRIFEYLIKIQFQIVIINNPSMFLALLLASLAIRGFGFSSYDCLLPNCQNCSSAYVCSSCPQFLQCCQPTCSNCLFQTQCSSCIDNYILNTELSLCQLADSCSQPVCSQCINSTCTLCMSGFVLNPYTYECTKCPANCVLCDLSKECIQCEATFFLSQGKVCEPCPLQCIKCNKNGVCIQCAPGFFIGYPYLLCTMCAIDNCTLCSTQKSCKICDDGYYLTALFQCNPCSSICATCFGKASNCTACPQNSYPLGGTSCALCNLTVPFCRTCLIDSSGIVICLSCLSGMYVSALKKCEKCSSGCLSCSSSMKCENCMTTYYLLNQTCYICNITNCLTCNNGASCSACSQGNVAINNQTSICMECPSNCKTCFANLVCISCIEGYVLQGKQCASCPLNCYFCSNPAYCQVCDNYFYALINGPCEPCPMFCVSCLSQSFCFQCQAGYYTNGTTCLRCPIDYCFECDFDETVSCSLCIEGYYLSTETQTCQSCTNNCLICNDSVSCDQCADGYYLLSSAGTCSACQASCLVCQGQSCLACQLGFYLQRASGLCLQCASGCQMCLSSSSCQSCHPGLYLSIYGNSQVSLKCSPQCLTCTSTSCTSCASGFTLNSSGLCQSCSDGCLRCGFGKICFQCQSGFALVKHQNTVVCEPCSLGCKKCKQFHDTRNCYECDFGLMLLSNGSCFLCGSSSSTQGCMECDYSGTCVLCADGYVLNSVNQCVNSNFVYQNNDKPLILACVGLGCLFVVLLMVLLFHKIK